MSGKQDISARDAALFWLRWQAEMGADEAIAPKPLDRLSPAPPHSAPRSALRQAAPGTHPTPVAAPPQPGNAPSPEGCHTLEELHAALDSLHHFPLRRMARHTVLTDGNPASGILLVGEAPGREEDLKGRPFVGRAGQLLDRMLAAIGLSRTAEDPAASVLITNVLFWRPPGNRKPTEAELGFCAPWFARLLALVKPRVIVTLGGTPTQRLAATGQGIMRLRGRWMQCAHEGLAEPVPLLPMLHPAYLLRTPGHKRLAWRDLIALRKFLDDNVK